MKEFAIAVKAFIINNNNEILLIKRHHKDVQGASDWEIPGGRLDSYDESPFCGLKREVLEETGLEVDILNPLQVDHFTRKDGQKITMLIFLCKALNEEVKLSEEHTEHVWMDVDEADQKLINHFHESINIFKKHFMS